MIRVGRAMDPFEAYTRHVNPTLGEFLSMAGRDVRFVRAHGSTIEDAEGRRYDDWISGFGSFNLGHNPPELKEAIREQIDGDAPNLFSENLNPYAGALAERLTKAAGPAFETCFFCNSGSEAVEAAIKTALLATGRKTIAYAAGGYHGTTLGALACMGKGLYRSDLEDVLADFAEVEFGDLDRLAGALAAGEAAAFIVEPIQVEGGMRIASKEYLEGAREICDRHGTLLVLDEVQTGMGRTGSLFAYQQTDAEPDIFLLAKSLGGGMVPIGAAVMRKGIWRRAYHGYLRCEIHNCTFGGNALGCAAASRALEILGDPSFLASVRQKGERLFTAMEAAVEGCPAVEAISWRGLLGGIRIREPEHPWMRWESLGLPELEGQPIAGPLLIERLFRRRILAQVCGHDWSVVRIEPPLTVEEEACGRLVDAVGEAVRWIEENG